MGRWWKAVGIVTLLLVAAVACGKSEQQKQAEQAVEQTKAAAEKVGGSAQEMAKGLEEMAKGMQQMAGGGGGTPVEPVSFTELQATFPELAGWTKGKPTGEKMTVPVPFSQATVRYTKGDSNIEAKAVDTGFNQLLIAPYTMFLATGYERQTENGYEKAVSVASYPGWEKWDSEDKHGELNVLVGKRFVVTFEGDGLADTKVLHDFVTNANLTKLAAIK